MACTEALILGDINGSAWMNVGGILMGSSHSELPLMFDFEDRNGEVFTITKPGVLDVSFQGATGLNGCCQISWTDQYRYRGQQARVTTGTSASPTLLFASINGGDISSLYGAKGGDVFRIILPNGMPLTTQPKVLSVSGTAFTFTGNHTIPAGSIITVGVVANDLTACCDITKMSSISNTDYKIWNSAVKIYPINFDQSCACEINQKSEFISVADYFKRKWSQVIEKFTSTIFFDFIYGNGINAINGLIPRIKEAEDCLADRPNETDLQLTYDFSDCCDDADQLELSACEFNKGRINDFNEILSNIYSSAGAGEYYILMNKEGAKALSILEREEHFFTTFGIGTLPVVYGSDVNGSNLEIYRRMTMKGIQISGAMFWFYESPRLSAILGTQAEPLYIIFPKDKVGLATLQFENVTDAINGTVTGDGKVFLVDDSENRRKASGVPFCFQLNGSFTIASVHKDLLAGGYRVITGLKPREMCTPLTCATPITLTVTPLECPRCP